MTRDVFRCKTYANPMKCKGYFQDGCRFCYRANSEQIDLCDVCGCEIDYWEDNYEDYHNPETGKDICEKCRKSIEIKGGKTWAFQS